MSKDFLFCYKFFNTWIIGKDFLFCYNFFDTCVQPSKLTNVVSCFGDLSSLSDHFVADANCDLS